MSDHFAARAIQRSISMDDIYEALTNPLKVGKIKNKEGQRSQEFIGQAARVHINPDTGNLVTTWATSKKMLKKLKG
jgi:hypothetical protein